MPWTLVPSAGLTALSDDARWAAVAKAESPLRRLLCLLCGDDRRLLSAIMPGLAEAGERPLSYHLHGSGGRRIPTVRALQAERSCCRPERRCLERGRGTPEDFIGGEFVLAEQRPRMQSRAMVVPLSRGDAVIFAARQRPVRGVRGQLLRQPASRRQRAPQRRVLYAGYHFHDAK